MKCLMMVCLIGILLFGCVQEKEIPKSVLDKFENLSNKYEHSEGGPQGALISFCTSNDENIYLVKGSDGMEYITYYYDNNGTYINEYFLPEMPLEMEQPPIDTSDYDCKTLKSSRS